MRRLTGDETTQRLTGIGLEQAKSLAYSYVDDGRQLAYGLHAHSRHQLLYAFEGSVRLEAERASYVLPPQRAAFIPAGVRHVTIVDRARIGSIYLDRSLVPGFGREVVVVAASALLREMIVHAARWPPERSADDPIANAFFKAFGLLCSEWIAEPIAARLPRGESREVRAAIEHVRGDLCGASLERTARVAGISPRTLRRRLQLELGTNYRELLGHVRAVRAMELLAEPDQRVTDVAFAVGYDSLSAFTKSFAAFAGETPSAYRARVRPITSPRAARRAPAGPRRA